MGVGGERERWMGGYLVLRSDPPLPSSLKMPEQVVHHFVNGLCHVVRGFVRVVRIRLRQARH